MITASLVVNAVFLYQKLKKEVYQRGIDKGVSLLSERVVSEVQEKGRIKVNTPSGTVLLRPVSRAMPTDPNVELNDGNNKS